MAEQILSFIDARLSEFVEVDDETSSYAQIFAAQLSNLELEILFYYALTDHGADFRRRSRDLELFSQRNTPWITEDQDREVFEAEPED